jgi:hypothetical protein
VENTVVAATKNTTKVDADNVDFLATRIFDDFERLSADVDDTLLMTITHLWAARV